jgi:hypothetical protein
MENVDRPGFGLEEFDSGYEMGNKIYSEASEEEVDTLLQNGLETAAILSETVADVTALVDTPLMKAVSGFFSVASGALGVASIWGAKSDADVTNSLINKRFNELSLQVSKLSDMVADGFSQIRKDLADNELDELMGYLQAIDYAYKNMLNATLTADMIPQVKKVYVDRYRDACNRPQFTADDIFRQFYGFACGDTGSSRDCDAANGDQTGVCRVMFTFIPI